MSASSQRFSGVNSRTNAPTELKLGLAAFGLQGSPSPQASADKTFQLHKLSKSFREKLNANWINHIQKLELIEIGIACADLPDSMFAHENSRFSIVY